MSLVDVELQVEECLKPEELARGRVDEVLAQPLGEADLMKEAIR